jgi:hypothetical protein
MITKVAVERKIEKKIHVEIWRDNEFNSWKVKPHVLTFDTIEEAKKFVEEESVTADVVYSEVIEIVEYNNPKNYGI